MRTGKHAVVSLSTTTLIETEHCFFSPSFLLLVTAQEMQALGQVLEKGVLPPDLERKLAALEVRDLMHQFIAQNCRLFSTLLMAVYSGMYKGITQRACDRILRVIAYVRKDEDAIPDYVNGGFTDDLHEVRSALSCFEPELQRFKAWRLTHQVPRMWQN